MVSSTDAAFLAGQTKTSARSPAQTGTPTRIRASPDNKRILGSVGGHSRGEGSTTTPVPITSENWNTVKDRLIHAIKDAEFIAFDLELTGLHRHSERFVGVDRCYEAHANGAKHFMPVQMGLCMAKRVRRGQG